MSDKFYPVKPLNDSGVLVPGLRLVDDGNGGLALAISVAGGGDEHIGQVGGNTARVSASFNRPANTTPYASGQLVANNVTNTSVTPMEFPVSRAAGLGGMIRRARIRKNNAGITNANFRLHLYSVAPTPANGDGGTWSTNQAANYIGAIDVSVGTIFTDGAAGNGVPNVGSEINFTSDVVYGLLEARGAYTPASGETFTVSLEVLQN